MIRIVENNDWVIFSLLGVGAMYLVMFIALQRGISMREFLVEKLANSQNVLVNWIIVSAGFCVVLSILWAAYIPMLPRWVENLKWEGIGLNKMGYFLLIISGYFLLKVFLSLFFYWSIGQATRYLGLVLVSQKFYFLASLVVMGLCIMHYYFPIDRLVAVEYHLLLLPIMLIAKMFFYAFYPEKALPEEWYSPTKLPSIR